jgi:hypothetical protein
MTDDPQSIQELENRLTALANDEAFRIFRPLVEGVRASASLPEAELPELNELLAVLADLRSRVDTAASTSDVIQHARSVQFTNPNLRTDQLQQAQNIYNLNLDKIQDEEAKPPVDVPIVLAVMNRTEADSLWDGTALADELPSGGTEIQHVQAFLEASTADIDHYGTTSRDWRPFGTAPGDPTIADLVTGVVSKMNANSGYDPPLEPSLRDIHSLAENWPEMSALRKEGCVLLVDGISMLHPVIVDSFRRSGLDLFPQVSIVRIDPRSGAWENARKLKVVLRLELSSLEFVRRSMEYTEDPYASSNASDAASLDTWLRSRVVTMHPPKSASPPRFRIAPT